MKPRLIFLKNALVLLLLLCAAVTSQAYAQATAPRSLPSRGALDIGAVSHPGAFVEEGTTVRIWAWGSDIGGRHDQFHYVWYDLPGDGEMTARLESQDATDGWAKAGIMLRETTYDNAANVFLALTPQHGARMQWRSATNVLTVETAGPRVAAPTWLKLVRSKNVITGAISANGTAWTTIRSVTVAMSATSKIGLAVTSHNNRVRNRSVFTNVALKLGASSPALTATQVYGQNGSFTDVTANNGGVSATSLNYPAGVVLDSNNNLYITDSINHRVLYYPAGSTTATRVYGQPDFTSYAVNNGGVSATSLNFPIGVALDSTNNLYISDFSNSRVLYYPADSTTATRVYGQGGSFTSNATGTDANSFKGSLEAAVDRAGNLYVADAYNNRVLLFAVS